MQQTLATPVQLEERAEVLDILRGFALLGIFINNSQAFSGYMYLSENLRKQFNTSSTDQWLGFLQATFVEGKFYTLFSLLFGIGFSIILVRNQQKGISSLSIFYRRLLILSMIGIAHLLLLWEGDILLLYAIIGCLLPLFRKCKDKTLLIWAACLIISPILVDTIKLIFHWRPAGFLFDLAQRIDKQNGVSLDENFAYFLFKDGSGYDEVLKWSQSGFFYRYEYIIESNRIPKVLGIFLIGFYAGRKMIYAKLGENKLLLMKIRRWGWIIGLPGSIAMTYFEGDHLIVPKDWMGLVDTIAYAVSVVPLSLAYVATFSLWFMNNRSSAINRWIANAGRMALTNYVAQTMIAITIYYGVGAGLGTRFGYTYVILIAVAVFILQVIYSNWWMRHFNYGPLEWLWRQLTYGKRLPLRKRKVEQMRRH